MAGDQRLKEVIPVTVMASLKNEVTYLLLSVAQSVVWYCGAVMLQYSALNVLFVSRAVGVLTGAAVWTGVCPDDRHRCSLSLTNSFSHSLTHSLSHSHTHCRGQSEQFGLECAQMIGTAAERRRNNSKRL